jgi:hypothetical protein
LEIEEVYMKFGQLIEGLIAMTLILPVFAMIMAFMSIGVVYMSIVESILELSWEPILSIRKRWDKSTDGYINGLNETRD